MAVIKSAMDNEKYMRLAILEAQKAYKNGEVPIGAIVVYDGKVIVIAHNQTITKNDPTAHAEILALRKAGKVLNNYRLNDITLYVTVEPCAMCAGAIINARIGKLVFGAYEPKSGCVSSKAHLFEAGLFNHTVEVLGGVLETECSAILSRFFRGKRIAKATNGV